jgi:P27 family predicted phage terminase small subunit
MKKPIDIPAGLSERARRLWDAVTAQYELDDHHLVLLESACRALDRAGAAAAVLERSGLTVTNKRGELRAHPLVGVERDARQLMARLLRELQLDIEAPQPIGRPAGNPGRGRTR